MEFFDRTPNCFGGTTTGPARTTCTATLEFLYIDKWNFVVSTKVTNNNHCTQENPSAEGLRPHAFVSPKPP